MLKLITDHLDVWASAELPAKTGGRGRAASNGKSPQGIQKLRELILELALRGKLVPQDPNDEPASELLKRIQVEKARLITEGKIKKDKPLPSIDEVEKPFDLPRGWVWVRLGEVAEIVRGVTYSKSDARDNPSPDYAPLLRGNNINRVLNFDGLVYVPKQLLNDAQFVRASDIVIAMSSGSADLVGKAAQATDNFDGGFGAFCGVVRSVSAELFNYFGFFFHTPFYKIRVAAHGKGIGINNLQKTALQTLEVPLPPLTEQYRIVAKVDELMALCDQLEQQQTDSSNAHQALVETLLSSLTKAEDDGDFAVAWQRIAAHFDTLFTTEQSIDQLKQTILQFAVMGKLVPQDPNDEPASELLKKASGGKAKLVKEEAIGKQKPWPPIESEEPPYELPQSWVWARLPDIAFFQEGPGIMAKDFRDTGIPLIRIAGMHNDLVSLEGCNFLDEDMVKKKWDHFKLELGDIVLSSSASLGKVAKVSGETVGCIAYTGLIRFQTYACIHADYLIRFLNSNEFVSQINKSKTGAAIMHFGPTHLKKMFVPLAPLSEQHRIVAKVDELMAICDALKARLNEAQITQVQLADAIVERAVSR